MTTTTRRVAKSQAGFTLVELAIVMIIIGLLITGVLKGQELIGNARITSTVGQIKAIDTATSTFKDMYAALPGDLLRPGDRLPNCTATGGCSTPGNGNSIIDTAPGVAPANESARYFVHLSAADILGGLNPAGTATAWNSLYPAANIDGGFHVGGVRVAADLANVISNTGARSGTYLVLTQTAGAEPAGVLTPNQAMRIDTKLDDGVPTTGSTRPNNAAACSAGGIYIENEPGAVCFLYTRIQG